MTAAELFARKMIYNGLMQVLRDHDRAMTELDSLWFEVKRTRRPMTQQETDELFERFKSSVNEHLRSVKKEMDTLYGSTPKLKRRY